MRRGTRPDAELRCIYRVIGRFLTADPYVAPGAVMNPTEWNRYAYVAGDPVNFYDPTGLLTERPHPPEPPSWTSPSVALWPLPWPQRDRWARIFPKFEDRIQRALEAHVELNARLRAQAEQAIEALDAGCKKAIEEARKAMEDGRRSEWNELKLLASETRYWDARAEIYGGISTRMRSRVIRSTLRWENMYLGHRTSPQC